MTVHPSNTKLYNLKFLTEVKQTTSNCALFHLRVKLLFNLLFSGKIKYYLHNSFS